MGGIEPRLGIVYEHPEWFAPLFAELARREIPYDRINVGAHTFDPAPAEGPWTIVLHRMSPSPPPPGPPAAAEGFPFPVIVNPNIGGSGAGIQRFDPPEALQEAAAAGAIDVGIGGTALVPEVLPAGGGHSV